MSAKASLRQQFRALRLALLESVEAAIVAQARRHCPALVPPGRHLGLYWPLAGEVDLRSLQALLPKQLALPAITAAPGDPAARLGRDALYFHYPHYYETTTPAGAVRAGDWKLLEYFEDGRTELYNLAADPGEERDLASFEPARAAELRTRLARWRSEVGAKMPTVNPTPRPARKSGG